MLNPKLIRQDFPIFTRAIHNKPLVYLDNASTTQKPASVLNALLDYYTEHNANIHRGIYTLSSEATAQYEGAREGFSSYINSKDPSTIVFVRNTTEAINLISRTWARRHIGEGDEIVISLMEHHSNLIPWQILADEKKAVLKFISITEDGRLNLEDTDNIITSRTKLVSITHMSNVFGSINPVKDLSVKAHRQGALILVDAAQSCGHMPIDVQDLDCDFMAFSLHKMLGPTGVGILYIRRELMDEMEPFLYGGDMIKQVWTDHAIYNDPPYKFEAGTPNIADVIASKAALDYLTTLGLENIKDYEAGLTAYCLDRLKKDTDIVIYGPKDAYLRGGVISFNYSDIHPHDVSQVLDYEGIAVRAGHHCCQPLMRYLNITGTVRASFYIYNTEEEVDILVSALSKAKDLFVTY